MSLEQDISDLKAFKNTRVFALLTEQGLIQRDTLVRQLVMPVTNIETFIDQERKKGQIAGLQVDLVTLALKRLEEEKRKAEIKDN